MPCKRRSRIAWLVRSVLPLILLAIFAIAGPATAPADTEAAAAPFEAEASEEGEEEGECVESSEDEVEEAGEVEEECEEGDEEAGASSGEDCLLRTAHARVVAFPARNQVRLTLGYTTFAPTRATVEYGAGSRIDAATRQLGRSGVVRLSKHLGDGAMNRLSGSHRFTVTLQFPEAPRGCDRLVTEQLKLQHGSDSRITWSQDR